MKCGCLNFHLWVNCSFIAHFVTSSLLQSFSPSSDSSQLAANDLGGHILCVNYLSVKGKRPPSPPSVSVGPSVPQRLSLCSLCCVALVAASVSFFLLAGRRHSAASCTSDWRVHITHFNIYPPSPSLSLYFPFTHHSSPPLLRLPFFPLPSCSFICPSSTSPPSSEHGTDVMPLGNFLGLVKKLTA